MTLPPVTNEQVNRPVEYPINFSVLLLLYQLLEGIVGIKFRRSVYFPKNKVNQFEQ